MKKLVAAIRKVEGPLARAGLVAACVSLTCMLVLEVANAIGRKLLKPVPVTVETAESLMITTIFLAIAYVALNEEHTYVSLITRKLRPTNKRYIDAFGHLVGAVILVFLTIGAWQAGWASMLQLEIRIGVIRFPIWIFRLFFAVGLSLFTLQLIFNTIKFLDQALDPEWDDQEAMGE
jgi:TRAP-type C4-dicarboxylate transport system permease small subunit